MKAPVSRIASNFRTVVPKTVRDRLGLKPGDLVRYVVDGERVAIERMNLQDDPLVLFTEWQSDADENAYGSL